MTEFLVWMLKSLVLLPVLALIEAPFIRVGARVVIARQLSFGASYMMALIAGAALLAANLVLWPVYAQIGKAMEAGLALAIALALSGWLYGYFLTNADGRSVGFGKGVLVVLLSSLLFGLAMIPIAFLIVWLVQLFGG